MIPQDFVRLMPKTDLHVHLDGSLRLSTLIELAESRGIALPSMTEAGLKAEVFKPSYADLDEYLSGFQWTVAVLQDSEALERAAYELAIDNWEEGVRYLEVRFAPQLHMGGGMSFADVLSAVDGGLRRAREEVNAGLDEAEPGFEYGIICSAMRYFTDNFSAWYRQLAEMHPWSERTELIQMASAELARAAVRLRQSSDVQIVGIDLAGSEYGNPAALHQEAFDIAHRAFLPKTVHAGEAYGPDSIFQALGKLHADRIGHGLHLFDADMVDRPSVQDPAAYIDALVNFVADRRITIEVCLTSNLQTSPAIRDIRDHSMQRMLERNLSLTICTDNRLVSHTSVTQEFNLALQAFGITPRQLKNIVVYGFKRSFFYRPYNEKRRYVRSVIDYYERLEREFGISEA